MTIHDERLSRLILADPETAAMIQKKLKEHFSPVTDHEIAWIVEETIQGLSQETALGHAIASGMIELTGSSRQNDLEMFISRVRQAGLKSAAVGRIIAIHLVPVIQTGDIRFIQRFDDAICTLLKIGAYTLPNPLEALSSILKSGDIESGLAFLDLLIRVFSPEMSYNQCKHLCHIIPKAVKLFPIYRRFFQIEQLARIAETDPSITEYFLDGMDRGIRLLGRMALERFVSEGLAQFRLNPAAGIQFFSLESQKARNLMDDLQIAVSFSQVRQGLDRYLQARIGGRLSVRPLSELSQLPLPGEAPWVCSSGKYIYLPDEIDRFDEKNDNRFLYKCLTRLEASYWEFGSYNFDFEMAVEMISSLPVHDKTGFSAAAAQYLPDALDVKTSDMQRFCNQFPMPELAADLLTIFEQGRIRLLLEQRYPGIICQTMPMLVQEACSDSFDFCPLQVLYAIVFFRIAVTDMPNIPGKLSEHFEAIELNFRSMMQHPSRIEVCSVLVWETYPWMESLILRYPATSGRRLETPFGIKLRPDLAADFSIETKAVQIKQKLAEKGIRVYKSEIRSRLIHQGGKLDKDDLITLIRVSQHSRPESLPDFPAIDWDDMDLSDLVSDFMDIVPPFPDVPATWYREWNCIHKDYLHNHVRVVDHLLEGKKEHAGFYEHTLLQHREQVSQIRHAFELMKPDGLKLLRNWTDGVELDYRAMLDFVLDRKAGHMPSDRLYIKRIKQERSVAVLLLVDISRSTGNPLVGLPEGNCQTVLDVEKEAIVLFSEALSIVGDDFAIAGFSGNGRLSVDYHHIKDFNEPLDEAVRRRIGGLKPQRSTRMGAAIRHAAACLENIPSKVKLMILIGDGFPNDMDYKQTYAIEDTRKSIGEAFARQIHTHAITVNMVQDARLDDLYGNVHHNVLSDVRELPAKLLRIYRSLTRSHHTE